ncbi:Methyltransf_2 domain-containing protein [Trichoderma simmonsii]|uniref:Methyltransf_2 domain-containing protein n=1 Tax=Trichoderma simmonsii TaxID=1491479 RepID=A0A8G0PFI5_9HYPO|nr:Methyltransf_2 domain-containing protein [Trichoderma simmonsii]
MSWSTFEELGNEILAQCKILDKFVKGQNLKKSELSFSNYDSWQAVIDCLNVNGSEVEKNARTDLLNKTADLRDLVLGPAGTVVWPALTYPYQLSTLKILNDFSIPQIIPRGKDESKTFSEITKALSEKISRDLDRRFTMSEDFVTRVIRHASTFHILAIDEENQRVRHTAPSQAFFCNPIPSSSSMKYSVQSTLTICLDLRFLNTAFRIGDALLRYGDIVEPYETAFNLAFDTPYDYLRYMADADNLELCETMLKHLTFVMSSRNMATRDHDQDILAKNVISRIKGQQPQQISKIVDMGGGWGDVCISIAKDLLKASKPLPQFVVADLERMITNGRDQLKQSKLDKKIKKKITFEKYNFIDEINQPDNADIYMFRFVMHDWSDSRVITILNNIVFNMKKDACILIMDYIIPKQDVFPLVVERLKRTMDMAAMSILAGKERTENDWVQLIARRRAFGVVELTLLSS